MSLSKLWKLALASLCAFSLVACAGSRQGGSEEAAEEYSEEAEGGSAKAQKVDEGELQRTQQEAMKMTEENH